jgi:hypothetical protein
MGSRHILPSGTTDGRGGGDRIGRRQFLLRGAGLAGAGLSLSALLEACTRSPSERTATPGPGVRYDPATYKEATKAVQDQAEVLVGDVLDYALTSDEWEGAFGFVTLRLHLGHVDGRDVYFIRTDASDEAFARKEKLIFVPKLAALVNEGMSGAAYLVAGGAADQGVVLSAEPGMARFTPAWRVHRVRLTGQPNALRSEADVRSAESAGDAVVEPTDVVLNAALVKWSTGELAVDPELKGYLGGSLIEPPDLSARTVTFKLGECFPGTRYFVTDHSIAPAAEMTKTAFAPRLQGGPSEAGATGRTNVFMNGLTGPGPMGFQPSAFDWPVGDPAWSPYWDHYTYAWKAGRPPRVLQSQRAVHAARDAGELTEFPGVPDTKGEVFTVNCPSPIAAPNVYPG